MISPGCTKWCPQGCPNIEPSPDDERRRRCGWFGDQLKYNRRRRRLERITECRGMREIPGTSDESEGNAA